MEIGKGKLGPNENKYWREHLYHLCSRMNGSLPAILVEEIFGKKPFAKISSVTFLLLEISLIWKL
ncbi:mCG1047587 [Mus musculus]|nr:mCG1047587 [Mus musculus]